MSHTVLERLASSGIREIRESMGGSAADLLDSVLSHWDGLAPSVKEAVVLDLMEKAPADPLLRLP